MFKIIKESFSKRKKLAKNHPEILRYEELEQRVLFSADVVPGLDTAAVEEQVNVQDVTSEAQVERETASETVEQTAEEKRSELVLVNENVNDYEQLITDLQASDDNRNIEVVVLESDRDGIEQVSEILSERTDLAALHVISHGTGGQINLGDTWLDSTTLQQNSDAVAGWGNALTEMGDILFYGCNIAADNDGQGLLDDIAQLTGADVAASEDMTGHNSLVGDWELEYQTGRIETSVAAGTELRHDWVSTLAPPTASDDAYAVDKGGTLNPDESWWDLNWDARRKLTFDNSGQTEDLVNFPVLVTLDSTRIDYTLTQPDGDDLRFVDADGTVLDHEIEGTWTSSGTNTVWVRVPQIDGSSNSDFIWMYYGNGDVASVENPAGVWSSDHLGVWHLNEDEAGIGNADFTWPPPFTRSLPTHQDIYQDSSSTTYHGDDEVSATGKEGQIGRGQQFDGTDDYINLWYSGIADEAYTAFTLSAWYKSDDGTIDDDDCIFWADAEAGSGSNVWPLIHFGITNDTGYEGRVRLELTHNYHEPTWGRAYGTTNLLDQEWHHLVAVRTGGADSRLILYVDGNEEANVADASGGQLLDFRPGDIQEFYIGAYEWQDKDYLNGSLDEVRLSNAAQTNDRIAAEYLSMTDSFITFSPAGVMTNDNDPDGDVLTAVLDSGPSYASSFRLSPDGSFVYVHDGGAATSDSFTYHLTDGTVDSGTATVTITINHAPTITSDGGGATAGINVAENTTAVTTVTATDANAGDTLTYSIDLASDDAAKFNINSTTGELSFDTAPDFESPTDANADNVYEVTVKVDDGKGGIDTQAISVTVTNVSPTTISTTGANTVLSGATYTLNLSANEDISSWTIDWGDGTTETFAGNPSSVTHIYNNAGPTYNILASVADAGGVFLQNQLLVPSYTTNDGLFRYEPNSGDFLELFATGDGLVDPYEVIVGPDGNTYVTGYTSDNVLRYDADGNFIDEFVTANSGGLDAPVGLAFGPDGNLYVGSFNTDSVLRYDGATGAFMDSFASGGGISEPMSIAFGPDGNLYVVGFASNNVVRYDGTTGAFMDVYVTAGSGGLNSPEDMAFGPDGNLYIASPTSNEVLRYNGTTGAFIDVFTSGGSLNGATGLAFSPEGYLYVSSYYGDNVLRFDATTGAYVDEYFAGGSGGLDGPTYLCFVPQQQVTVISNVVPVVTASAGTTSYTEQSSATVIDAGITLVDADGFAGVDPSDQYTAVVQITGNHEAADTLGFTNTSNIQGVLVGNTLTLSVIGGQTATVADFQAALRTVTFYNGSDTPSELNRTVTFSFDDGLDSSNLATKTLTLTAINDDPTNAGLLQSASVVTEDVSSTINLSAINLSDVDAGAGELTMTLTTSTGGNLTAAAGTGITIGGNGTGVLTLTGNLTDLNTYLDAVGDVTYLHSIAHTNGFAADTIQVDVTDNGNTGSGGGGTITLGTFNVDITALNDAPLGANHTVSTNEDTDYVFAAGDFGFTDPNDSPADNFTNVIITTTVANGTLYVDANGNGIVDGGEALSDLDTVSVADIIAGRLKFKPAANANGTNYASFAFQVVDDGGGTDTDLTANTMTINVTAVNDAAPVAGDDAYTVNEDNTLTADWWNTNWTRRQQLTFDNLAQAETLTDFPVLVILNSGNIDYTQTKDDGSDLRFFAADGTQLAYEIEQWDEGGDSSVWVRVPQITGNSNSDSFWMYYGNAAAQPVSNAADVWDSNFVGVWHLNQEQGGTGNVGIYKDSSGTGNNGIDRVAATGQDGQVTDGQEFGTSDWIEIAHDASLDLKDSMTISFWIKPTSDSGTFNRVVEKGLWGYKNSYYFGGGNGTNDLTFYLNNREVFDTTDNVLTVGQWQHCTVSYTSNGDGTAGSARLYINGVEVDINGDPAGVAAPPIGTYNGGTIAGNTGRLAIGHENSSYDFDGFIDEVQISNTDRSADWIAAQYQATKNQFGTEFVQFGGEESAPAIGGVLSNDSDVDNDRLIVTLVDGPDNAQSFTLNKDGTFTYTPTANYHGTDTFTYEVNDGNGGTTQASATITVTPVNDTPVINNATFALDENSANGTAVGTVPVIDPDAGDTHVYSIIAGNTGGAYAIDNAGTITVANSTALNFETTPVFTLTVQVQDQGGTGLTNTATITITLNDLNEAPVAREDRVGLTFDGVDDYVRIGDYPGLAVSNSVTMEAWIRPSGAGTGTQVIVNKEGEYEIAITSDTGEIKWSFANTDPGWGWHNTGYFAQAGEWTHIAVTYNNGVVNTYADGALVDTYNGTGVIADEYPVFNELQIGGRENAVTQRFDGQIDEVRVWNTERTQLEIQTNMNTLLAGNETGLLGNWRFDEGSGTTVTDQSVNGHHGTLADGVTGAEMPAWEGYVVSEDGALNVSTADGVLANDFDIDEDPLTAVLDSGPSNATSFTLNPDGSFTYTPVANFNGVDSFTYHANDGSEDSNIVTVTIRVDPANDAPVIGDAIFTLDENSTNGTAVGSVPVTDPDAGDTHFYSITAGNTGGAFAIDNAGNITVANSTALDFETTPVFTLTVQVQDQAGTGLIDTATITVNVNDINEFVPVANDATVAINEDAANGTSVHSVVATDDDATANLTYSIIGGNVDGVFTVDANTGEITIADNTNLDRETSASYSLTVEVSDGTNTDNATITVNVGDVDEFDVGPVTDSDVAANSVAEDAIAGTTVGVTALADDADATDNVTYSLSDDAGGLFAIDANTGVITVANALDFETATSHSVTVLATSSDTSTSSQAFTISVTDINESAVGPVSDIDGSANTVTENTSVGDAVGIIALATDPDGIDTVTYSLSDDAGGLFAIDANTGVITVASALDYETATSHSVTVLATSSDTSTSSQVFTINITDVNEPPVISDATFNIDENSTNGAAVGTVPVTDPDTGDNQVYSITAGNTSGAFAIDNAGNITVANSTALDFETTPVFILTVQVQDQGGTGLVDAATITVNLNNLNEAPVNLGIANVSVGEDAPNTVIDLFAAFADTEDADASLTYTITANTNPGLFAATPIDGVAGTLTLDYAPNAFGTANITVRATDTSALWAEDTFTVTVNPVNDAPATTPVTLTAIGEDSGGRLITQAELLANATDVDGPALTATNLTLSAGSGTLVDNGDGTWNYTPAANNDTSARFTYSVTDGSLTTAGSANLDITPANDNDRADSSDTNPTILLLEDPVTDDDEDSDVESPIYEAPTEDSITEDEVVSPVEAIQTPQDSADADEPIVQIKDPQDEETQDIIYLTDEMDRNTQPEERDDDRAYIYYDNDLYKDISLSNHLSFNGLSAENEPVAVSLDDINILDFDSDDTDPVITNEDYEALRREIDESFNSELKSQGIKAKIVTATAATFTVGIVSYLLRAGSLVASMMSALPLWRGFDPIAIFSGNKKKKTKQDEISDTGELKPEAFFDGDAE